MSGQAGILHRDAAEEVVAVLAEAFFDYPVMRFVLGPDGDYPERLRRLVDFFVVARFLRGEVVLGIGERTRPAEGRPDAAGLAAVALVSRDDVRPSPPELAEIREDTWSVLGAEARSRYETFGASVPRFGVHAPHLHLNMIGVRRRAQGQGLAGRLLDRVHTLSAADDRSRGVTLTTEVASNVGLYERFGYHVVGTADVASAFTTWAMYRPDQTTVAGP